MTITTLSFAVSRSIKNKLDAYSETGKSSARAMRRKRTANMRRTAT